MPSRRAPRDARRRLATVLVCVLAGLLLATSARAARGMDLRPSRNTELVDLVRSQRDQSQRLARDVATLREEVDRLAGTDQLPDIGERLTATGEAAGLEPVSGEGVTVVLTDAPAEVQPAGVDPDVLVVHQQDIQAVLNLLWAGGARGVTLQGQRVVATTGVKCVGNTVVIHGVPYAPPYVISAVGDPVRMEHTLAESSFVRAYKEIAATYQLGWEQRREVHLSLPAYEGAVDLRYARPAR